MSAVQELDFTWLESAVGEQSRASFEGPYRFASNAPAFRSTAPEKTERPPAECVDRETPNKAAGRSRPSLPGAFCFHSSSALAAFTMVCLLWVSLGMEIVRPSDSVGFAALVALFGGSLILSTIVMTLYTLRRSGA